MEGGAVSATADEIPILSALRRLLAASDRDLWGYDEIAAYAKAKRNYIANVVTQHPSFPKPIRPMGNGHPRWPKCEVIAWYESQR